jgi:hypothetical protein
MKAVKLFLLLVITSVMIGCAGPDGADSDPSYGQDTFQSQPYDTHRDLINQYPNRRPAGAMRGGGRR